MTRLRLIVQLILGFGERNPGLTRILTGHALMFEQLLRFTPAGRQSAASEPQSLR